MSRAAVPAISQVARRNGHLYAIGARPEPWALPTISSGESIPLPTRGTGIRRLVPCRIDPPAVTGDVPARSLSGRVA